MNPRGMDIVIVGLSITSSWGNGHATTYRCLVRELSRRGHRVTFLERDVPWYARERDLPKASYCDIHLYPDVDFLRAEHAERIRDADVVIVGSWVPDGAEIGEWVSRAARGLIAFYDIDTPVTLARLQRNECPYLSRELIPRYHLYLSFTGGPTLKRLEKQLGSPCARALHCAVDPEAYHPEAVEKRWDLGYLGTYSPDRQPALEQLMLAPARSWDQGRFVVGGPLYPDDIRWPRNVELIPHVAPADHRRFYNEQRFTLNITRADMVAAGYSPSVRLFEAAACGAAVISDAWEGLEDFFEPGTEILVARGSGDAHRLLRDMPVAEREAVGRGARERVLRGHTAAHRAAELESHLLEAIRRG